MADDRQLLTDVSLQVLHHELRPVYRVATTQAWRSGAQSAALIEDFAVLTGRDNLVQAVLLRLLTPRGELTALAHPDYGSRLHEVIGLPNTDTTRNLVKLYILESLQQEPRIAKTTDVSVEPDSVERDRVNVSIQVQPVGPVSVVTIGPFSLQLGTGASA
jgi:phage baseplate assembly protein W